MKEGRDNQETTDENEEGKKEAGTQRERRKEGMGRRRKHHGGSRLASDQLHRENQNNICLRPCHSLWYHHQAFRDDTQAALYSLATSNASDDTIR